MRLRAHPFFTVIGILLLVGNLGDNFFCGWVAMVGSGIFGFPGCHLALLFAQPAAEPSLG